MSDWIAPRLTIALAFNSCGPTVVSGVGDWKPLRWMRLPVTTISAGAAVPAAGSAVAGAGAAASGAAVSSACAASARPAQARAVKATIAARGTLLKRRRSSGSFPLIRLPLPLGDVD